MDLIGTARAHGLADEGRDRLRALFGGSGAERPEAAGSEHLDRPAGHDPRGADAYIDKREPAEDPLSPRERQVLQLGLVRYAIRRGIVEP